MSSLIRISSACPSEDLFIVRITGLAFLAVAAFVAAVATAVVATAAVDAVAADRDLEVSIANGFMVLNIAGWPGFAAGLLTLGWEAAAGAGFDARIWFGVEGGVLFIVPGFAPVRAVVAVGFVAV